MNGMDQERFDDLKNSYVLGALPEEEHTEFEQYLATHPDLQAEVDELGLVAGLLAFAPEEREPASDLRTRIMDTVDAEAVTPGTSRESWLDRLRATIGFREIALGVAAVLVIGMFSWSLLLQGEVQDLQGRVQSLQGQSQTYQTIALGGTGTQQEAQAEVLTLKDGRTVLVAEDLPPVPEGKTYQIWVIKGDTPQPSGLFEVQGDSIATLVETPVEGADVVAVTVEPDGGSAAPTTDPILVGEVKS